MEAELSGNSNTSFLFFNNSFLDLKAMFTKFGNTIAMLEQKHGLKPQEILNAKVLTKNRKPTLSLKTIFQVKNWYENKLDSSSWKDFNIHINELADVCEYFFYKISSRMDYSYKAKDDQNREDVPLRKPLVSQAMKRNAKNQPSVLKKMKPNQ
ncbi:hypothetical protein TYRP_023712 [Tyrophagus putrescentiae]|nr:hypothetical protein TYRP_023712 [Tyrophagus putrescentiae]